MMSKYSNLISRSELYFWITLVLRFTMGIASSFYFLAVCSIVAAMYPKDLTRAMGIYNTFFGIGMMMGVLIGTGIYWAFGHVTTFVSISAALALQVCFYLKWIPTEDAIDDNKRKTLLDSNEI